MIGAGILLLAALFLWLFLLFFSPSTSKTSITNSNNATSTGLFGSANQNTTNTSTNNAAGTNQVLGISANGTPQQIFEISTGPVAGAVFRQGGVPTTTVARYVMADSGHVFDLAVDVPGAVAQSVL